MENEIQRNAKAFEKLLGIEYYICLGEKGKGYEVHLTFKEEDFAHLEGLRQLKDLPIADYLSKPLFGLAVNGDIKKEDLISSIYYAPEHVEVKIDLLYLLETALDHNDMIFRCVKDSIEKFG